MPDLNAEVASRAAAETRLNQQIKDVLATTPGGDKLDAYFGISSEVPEQPAEEAARSEQLIDSLKKATSSGDLSALLEQIAEHAAGSGADPDALRALMRRGASASERSTTDPKEKIALSTFTAGHLKHVLQQSDPDVPVFFRCTQPTGNIVHVDYARLSEQGPAGQSTSSVIITAAFPEDLDDDGELRVDAWGRELADGTRGTIAAGCLKAGQLLKVLEQYDHQLPVFVTGSYVPGEIQPARSAGASTWGFFGRSLPCVIIE